MPVRIRFCGGDRLSKPKAIAARLLKRNLAKHAKVNVSAVVLPS